MTHEIMVLCDCGDIEHCEMERYVSDVRIAHAYIHHLLEERRILWGEGQLPRVPMPTLDCSKLPVTMA